MRVQPDTAELFGFQTGIHLFVVEIGDGFVIELNGDRRALLTYQTDVLNQQQIIGRRDGEAADLGITRVPQVQQLGPRVGGEPDCGAFRSTPSLSG